MKKLYILFILLILSACSSPNIELLEEDVTPIIKSSNISSYIQDIQYSYGEKEEGQFPINISIKATEEFSAKEDSEIFYNIAHTVESLAEYPGLYCSNRDCFYNLVEIKSGEHEYKMDFVNITTPYNLTLVIDNKRKVVGKELEEEERQRELAEREADEQKSTTSSETASDNEIYRWMMQAYDELTNYGENYNAEFHDSLVADLASREFGITSQEASDLYVRKEFERAMQ